MEIRLIALDMDGTLLDSRKKLSQANRQALCACIEKDIMIVPSTGRTVDGIPEEVKSIPGIRYAVTTNGAVIEDMQQKKKLDSRLMSWEQALSLLQMVDSCHVMYDPYIDGRGISEPRFFDHMEEYGLPSEIQALVRRTRDIHENIIEFVKISKKPVEKINLFFPNSQEKARVRRLLEQRDDVLITPSMPFNLEINALGATKGEGLLRLGKHLGISREEMMAVGDGENDVSMLQAAGIGVAMKNSKTELFDFADYITDSNDEDGVAKAIAHFLPKLNLF